MITIANPDNLVPNSERTPSERQEIARKAGKESGKARRRKAEAKKIVELLGSLPLKSDPLDNFKQLSSLTEANKANLTLDELAWINQYHIAISDRGTASTKSLELILKAKGQYPKDAAEDVKISVTWGEPSDKDD